MRPPVPIQKLLLYLSVHGEIKKPTAFLKEWKISESIYAYWRKILRRKGIITILREGKESTIKANKEAIDDLLINLTFASYREFEKLHDILKGIFNTNIPQIVTLNITYAKVLEFDRRSPLLLDTLRIAAIKALEALLCLPGNIGKVVELKSEHREVIKKCLLHIYPFTELGEIDDVLLSKLANLRLRIDKKLEGVILDAILEEERQIGIYGNIRTLKEEYILSVRGMLETIIDYFASKLAK